MTCSKLYCSIWDISEFELWCYHNYFCSYMSNEFCTFFCRMENHVLDPFSPPFWRFFDKSFQIFLQIFTFIPCLVPLFDETYCSPYFLSTCDVITKSTFGPTLLIVSRSQTPDWTDIYTKYIRPSPEVSLPSIFHISLADFHWFLHKMNENRHLCNETIHLVFVFQRIVPYNRHWK